jgi:anti-sigma factor (TIGR02949 family)
MSDVQRMTCEDALRRVQEFLDGELDDVSPDQVRGHFDICQRCYPHLRFEESFRKAVQRAAGRETAPAELRERLLRMIAEPPAQE